MWVRTGEQLKAWRVRQSWDVGRAALWGGYTVKNWSDYEIGRIRVPLPLIQRIREFEWRRANGKSTTPEL